MKSQPVPLLLALLTLIGAGVYVAASAPEAALSATWTPPVASGCFVPADAYLIDWRTMDGRAGRDTTYTAVWNDYPVGTFRFRVAGYSFARDVDGQTVIAWNIGRPTTGNGCALAAAETLWSDWSGWGSNGSPGQPGTPVFGAVLK